MMRRVLAAELLSGGSGETERGRHLLQMLVAMSDFLKVRAPTIPALRPPPAFASRSVVPSSHYPLQSISLCPLQDGIHLSLSLAGRRSSLSVPCRKAFISLCLLQEGFPLSISCRKASISLCLLQEGFHLSLSLAGRRPSLSVSCRKASISLCLLQEGFHLSLSLAGRRPSLSVSCRKASISLCLLQEGVHLSLSLAGRLPSLSVSCRKASISLCLLQEGVHLSLSLAGRRPSLSLSCRKAFPCVSCSSRGTSTSGTGLTTAPRSFASSPESAFVPSAVSNRGRFKVVL